MNHDSVATPPLRFGDAGLDDAQVRGARCGRSETPSTRDQHRGVVARREQRQRLHLREVVEPERQRLEQVAHRLDVERPQRRRAGGRCPPTGHGEGGRVGRRPRARQVRVEDGGEGSHAGIVSAPARVGSAGVDGGAQRRAARRGRPSGRRRTRGRRVGRGVPASRARASRAKPTPITGSAAPCSITSSRPGRSRSSSSPSTTGMKPDIASSARGAGRPAGEAERVRHHAALREPAEHDPVGREAEALRQARRTRRRGRSKSARTSPDRGSRRGRRRTSGRRRAAATAAPRGVTPTSRRCGIELVEQAVQVVLVGAASVQQDEGALGLAGGGSNALDKGHAGRLLYCGTGILLSGQPDVKLPPAYLDEPELAAWRGMLRVHARLIRELSAELEQAHGLPLSSYEVLLVLSHVAGRADADGRAGRRRAALAVRDHAAGRPARQRRPGREDAVRARSPRLVRRAHRRRPRRASPRRAAPIWPACGRASTSSSRPSQQVMLATDLGPAPARRRADDPPVLRLVGASWRRGRAGAPRRRPSPPPAGSRTAPRRRGRPCAGRRAPGRGTRPGPRARS